MSVISFLLRRLTEASTWAGIGAAAAATEAALHSHAALIPALLAGVVAFLTPEKKS